MLVLAITTGGMREFVFYSRKPDDVEQAISKVRIKHKSHVVQFYVAEDSVWEVHKEYS